MLNSPVSYISIDVNSYVELALNRFDTVVEASAYNDGGANVIADTDLISKNILWLNAIGYFYRILKIIPIYDKMKYIKI